MSFPGKTPSQNRTPFLISSMAKLSAMRETINVEDKKEGGGGGDAEDRTGLSGNTGGSDNKTRARRSKSKDDGKQKNMQCAAKIVRKDSKDL